MVEGFRFSMQSILDISKDEEEEAKKSYESLMYDLSTLRNNLSVVDEQIRDNSSIVGVSDSYSLQLKRAYLLSLGIQKKELEKSIEIKSKEVELCRVVYVEKQVDRQIIESMREKELEEFTQRVDMEEQERNDEFALYSYVKNR